MPDRRRLKRKHLVVYPKVTDVRSGKMLGRVGDITREGLLILSESDVPVHANYEVEIELPEDAVLHPNSRMRAVIRTDWSEPDANPKLKCIGSHFVDLPPDGLELIDDAIMFYGFRS